MRSKMGQRGGGWQEGKNTTLGYFLYKTMKQSPLFGPALMENPHNRGYGTPAVPQALCWDSHEIPVSNPTCGQGNPQRG